MLYRPIFVLMVLLIGSLFTGISTAVDDDTNSVPPAPDDLIIAICEREVSLRWSPGGTENYGTYQYRIYRGTSSGNETLYKIVDDTTRVYKDPNGDRNVTFYYYITAVNQNGESKPSREVKATPYCGPIEPNPPRNLTYIESEGNIELDWDEPEPDDGGYILYRYRIYRNKSGEGFELLNTVSSKQTNYTDMSVDTDLSYRYYVTALNSIGPSARSEIIEVGSTDEKGTQRSLGNLETIIPFALVIAILLIIVKKKFSH